MGHVSASEFRKHLAQYLDQVVADSAELVVTRQGSESVVVVSERDWAGMQETLYLLSSPANAEHLRKSIAEADAGLLVEHDLIDP